MLPLPVNLDCQALNSLALLLRVSYVLCSNMNLICILHYFFFREKTKYIFT